MFLDLKGRGTCGAGRSQGVRGGLYYFCLGAVQRNEQGGVKEKKRMFQSKANEDKASDDWKNRKSHNLVWERIVNDQKAATQLNNQEIWLLQAEEQT